MDDLMAAAEEPGFPIGQDELVECAQTIDGRPVRPLGGLAGPGRLPPDRPHLIDLPFVVAGAVKIVYDLWLYRAFVSYEPGGEG